MKYYVIPNIKEIDKYVELANKEDLGFEYNDFYVPAILDNEEELERRIKAYQVLGRQGDTMHGVFFDIVLDSSDDLIRNVSFMRVKSSLEIATKLNLKGVVFHTNYITWMENNESYRKKWVMSNGDAYLNLIKEYPNLNIYIENMFDTAPYMLRDLMQYTNHPQIRVCLDIAHASLSKTPLSIWFKELGSYIKHIHINDNDKKSDLHETLGAGLIDYKEAFSYIKGLKQDLSILIEINDYDKTLASIKYLKDGGYYGNK